MDGECLTSSNSVAPANNSGKVFTRLFKTTGIAFPKSVQSRIPRFGSQTDLEQDAAEPRSPGAASIASDQVPSSATSTAKASGGSGFLMAKAVDNGTPSRLALFRAKNWTKEGGKKRPLEPAENAMQPPKRRAVTSLFSDEPRRYPASVVGDGEDEEAAEHDRFSETTSVVSNGEMSSATSHSQSYSTDSFEDAQLRYQQEIKVGLCLQQDLTRDNARMKLKMDNLRDDIDYYYELLAKIEALALSAKRQAVATSGDGADAAGIVGLAEAIQRIISASTSDQQSTQ